MEKLCFTIPAMLAQFEHLLQKITIKLDQIQFPNCAMCILIRSGHLLAGSGSAFRACRSGSGSVSISKKCKADYTFSRKFIETFQNSKILKILTPLKLFLFEGLE
jgi:hypothetical protein